MSCQSRPCRHSLPFMLLFGAQQCFALFCRPTQGDTAAMNLSFTYLKSSVNFNCHSNQQMAWNASILICGAAEKAVNSYRQIYQMQLCKYSQLFDNNGPFTATASLQQTYLFLSFFLFRYT